MKWFKHYSDAHKNLKLRALINAYDWKGYGVWWIVCEIVSKEGTHPPEITWEASSFYFNPQKRYLSLTVIALVAGGGGILFFRGDMLTAIFLLLCSLILILYAGKSPEVSKISINQRGIAIGETVYYYKDLRSFWIHYEPGSLKELSLEAKKWYMPYVKVSIENKNPLVMRSLLVNFIPEKEHEHSLVDIISRKIGL